MMEYVTLNNVLPPVAHEPFQRYHKGVINGNVPVVQRLHARLFNVVPGHLSGRNGDNVPLRG